MAVYVSDKVPEVVIGDQERFGQIVTNLVGNSVKVCPQKLSCIFFNISEFLIVSSESWLFF